ncbi:Nitrate reductase [Alkaliphilus metalliredigens QYMF]|uniref:Nitrate reductase n=1 Tax=Alkaliphilus metalliredigens (strain QYMF) TaxID=293826 RepID=A6TWZ9_ALKMQ|nr:molybdopterin-dependent oxidoreductase [Alkaliphilus metalliredigens]ABR50717.1 Nitrate reductase [Alkaliphilus metalliredigens QYMF]
MKKVQTACPLDCWDCCAIEVTTNEGEIINVQGDKHHPITKGFLCEKGLKHLERLSSTKRLNTPMKKTDGQWHSISWEKAIAEIGDKLLEIKRKCGSTALIHYSEGGHGGLSKNIDTAFFNAYGGVTSPMGSLCWGAGIAAQTLDFGKVLSHDPEDLLNAQTIIVWGRNPAYTNIHLLPFLKKAQKKGTQLVVIDPIKTATAKMADHYYSVKPESDGFLALAMAKIMIENNWINVDFITQYCDGFEDFHGYLQNLDLNMLVEKTGLSIDSVQSLATLYACHGPSAIILGYGLQRYTHGGKNIRLIDALGALSGNIGIPGGGVSYANQYVSQWLDHDYLRNEQNHSVPSFKKGLFSQYVLQDRHESLEGIFITKANPVVQLPNTSDTIKAFDSIPFKVTIDHFMTDTAQLSDYVLPCTHIFEEEDFLHSSMWHPYFHYTERVVPPQNGVKSEFEIFKLLAEYMNMTDYLDQYGCQRTYLEKGLRPLLKKFNSTLDDIQGKRLKLTGNEIPWQDKIFYTSNKKFNLFCLQVSELPFTENFNTEYPLQLLSVHPKHSLHTQHYIDTDNLMLPKVYCHPNTLNQWHVHDGDRVKVISPTGELHVRIVLDSDVSPNLLLIYEGWWLTHGGVNHLTPLGVSDIGDQATYNNCFCKIPPISL